MVKVRNEQIAGLSKRQYDDYAGRVLNHLREMYPEFYYTREEPQLRDFILESVGRARYYGLTDEYAVLRYIDYRVLLGLQFDYTPEYAWITRILSDQERPELQRIKDIDRNQFGGALEEPFPYGG